MTGPGSGPGAVPGPDGAAPTSRRTAPVHRPENLREAAEAVAEEARAGRPLRIRGAGTATAWGAVRAPDGAAVLDTTALSGVRRHDPEDMVAVVGAGTPLAAVQRALAPHGQRLALDPARAARGATLGGLLATADAGPLRHAHGGPRDLVLGLTAVLADGTVTRSGGRVIKNVAGYDLAKLFSGSFGGLGLVAEVALRLHPRPEATATWAVPCPSAEAFPLARAVLRLPVEPVAVEWADGRLLIRFEGAPDGLRDRLERLRALPALPAGTALRGAEEAAAWEAAARTADAGAGENGDGDGDGAGRGRETDGNAGPAATAPTAPGPQHPARPAATGRATAGPAATRQPTEAPAATRGPTADGAASGTGEAVFRVTALPSDFPLTDGAAPGTARRVREVAVGVETVRVPAGPDGAAAVAAYRAAAARPGRTYLPHTPEAGAPVPSDPAALPALRAVKAAFDPDGRLPDLPGLAARPPDTPVDPEREPPCDRN